MLYWNILSIETLEGEYWLPVVNYEGLYEVSNMGRVKSLGSSFTHKGGWLIPKNGKILKQNLDSDGYPIVGLSKNRKTTTRKVHRLVAIAWICNPENKPEVNHKKGIKIDNRDTQLEWNTSSENQKHAFNTGLQKAQKPWLGKLGADNPRSKKISQYSLGGDFIKSFYGASEAGREVGIDAWGICLAAKGKLKKSGGFIWKYD